MEPSETDQSNKKSVSKSAIIIPIVIILLVLYTVINIWFFFSSGIVKKTANLFPLANSPASIAAKQTPSNASQTGFPTGNSTPQTGTPTSIPTPTPTPTPPLQGPGRYACDPYGTCKDYSDEMRTNCTVTFADRNCLGQCGNTAKRCSQ